MKRALAAAILYFNTFMVAPVASPCAHGQLYRVTLHKCVARSSPLARFVHFRHQQLPRAKAMVDHTPLPPEARPGVADSSSPSPKATSGLTPRGPIVETATGQSQSIASPPFELPSSRWNHLATVHWILR